MCSLAFGNNITAIVNALFFKVNFYSIINIYFMINAIRSVLGDKYICVNREDDTPYMLIECKTFGKEHNKELVRIRSTTKFSGCEKFCVVLLSAIISLP